MKKAFLTMALLIGVAGLFAQINTDYFGMPNELYSNEILQSRFTGDDMPVIDITPTIALPSPTSMPSGIAWDGTYLWVCGYLENRIFCIDPQTGDIIKTIPLLINRPYGISYHDSVLYVLDTEQKRVVELSYSGIVTDTIALLDYGNFVFPTGLYVCNNNLVFNDAKGASPANTGDSTYILNQNQLSGFAAYADFPSGIACDGEYLYVTDNPSQTTAKIDPNGFILVGRYTAPGGAYPNGLAWSNNGLWYVNNASDSIYFVPHVATHNDITENTYRSFIYPNPAQNHLNFSSDYPDHVLIIDAAGRVVAERNGEQSLYIGNLNNGLYLVCSDQKKEKLIIRR